MSALAAALASMAVALAVLVAPQAASAEDCVVTEKLVNPCRPWVGAAVGNYGVSGFRNNITHHETRAGRQLDIVHDYLQPNGRISDDHRYFINRPGTLLLLNWKLADNFGAAGGGNATVNAYIDRFADDMNALGDKKIFLNIWHEPENDVSAGGAPSCGTKVLRGRSGTAAQYRALWHNVRARFDAKGVDNVVYVMNYMGYTNWYCMTRDLWPGNDYVDWVMFDPYPNNTTWRPYIDSFYNHLLSQRTAEHDFTSKPWGLAEYGYKGTSQTAARQIYADLRANLTRFPRLQAYVVWDNVGNLDIRVRHSSTGTVDELEQRAYNTLVNDPLFLQSWTTTPDEDETPPDAPADLSATDVPGAQAGVSLTWAAAADNVGVTAYTISRNGAAIATITGTSYLDESVEHVTTYTYSVTAKDAAGNTSAHSNAATVTTSGPSGPVDSIPPDPPTGATATLEGFTPRVTWSPSTDNVAVTGYNVYRGATLVGTTSTTQYLDSSAPANTTVSYTVRAFDGAGNISAGSNSAIVAIPRDTVVPGRVTAFTVAAGPIGSRSITVSWGAATDNAGIASYWLYRGNSRFRELPGNQLSFTDTGLTAGTSYTYKVYAIDVGGNWGPSSGNATTTAR